MAQNQTSYVLATEAAKLPSNQRQVGQHVHETNAQGELIKSRVFSKDEGTIHLRPGDRDKSVTQRFLEGHADAKAGKIQIVEPQQAKLAVAKSDDLRKLSALLAIVKARVDTLEEEKITEHLRWTVFNGNENQIQN